jgi:hypothetical protein
MRLQNKQIGQYRLHFPVKSYHNPHQRGIPLGGDGTFANNGVFRSLWPGKASVSYFERYKSREPMERKGICSPQNTMADHVCIVKFSSGLRSVSQGILDAKSGMSSKMSGEIDLSLCLDIWRVAIDTKDRNNHKLIHA